MDFFGILYLILLFLLCFAIVHFVKLAYVGFLSIKNLPEEPKPKESAPVYYIVEKKRKQKSTYSSPKEIAFK